MVQVVAICNTYNEEHIVEMTARDIISQGCKLHVIDDHSTDNTQNILTMLQEEFGKDKLQWQLSKTSKSEFHLQELLNEKSRIAVSLYKDWWVINMDADEFRRAPFEKMTVVDLCTKAEKEGYTALLTDILEFAPIESFDPKVEWDKQFDRCEWMGFAHQKAWQQKHHITKLRAGGLRITNRYPGIKFAPYRIIAFHFPLVTIEEGMKKIHKNRKTRYARKEVARKHHCHYRERMTLEGLLAFSNVKHYQQSFVKDQMMGKVYEANEKFLF